MLTHMQTHTHTHTQIPHYLTDYILGVHGWHSIIKKIHQYNSLYSKMIREKHTIIIDQDFETVNNYLLQKLLINKSYKGTSLAL